MRPYLLLGMGAAGLINDVPGHLPRSLNLQAGWPEVCPGDSARSVLIIVPRVAWGCILGLAHATMTCRSGPVFEAQAKGLGGSSVPRRREWKVRKIQVVGEIQDGSRKVASTEYLMYCVVYSTPSPTLR